MTNSSPNQHFEKDAAPASPNRAERKAPIDSDALTDALRQSFQATVDEGVPDGLMDLINKLK